MESIIFEEFNNRKSDLNLLIELTLLLDEGNQLTISNNDNEVKGELIINEQLIDILKSAIQIINYNQVESTFRGCVESIYDHMEDSNVGYDCLKPPIQQKVIAGISKAYEKNNQLHKGISNDINLRSPRASLSIRKEFNGNIDTETIKNLKKNYGITIQSPADCRNGCELDTLKDARNDLAHGNKSFSAHGRDEPLNEVIKRSERISDYLKATIVSFDSYTYGKSYIAASES